MTANFTRLLARSQHAKCILTTAFVRHSSTMSSKITDFAIGRGRLQVCHRITFPKLVRDRRVNTIEGQEFPPLKPGVLRMYNMRFCPYAQRTRLVLEHKGIPYEMVNINLKRKPEWLFERNPIGLVPILEWDGNVLHESATCNDYLDDAYPGEKLNPRDPYLRARDRQIWESMNKMISSFYDVAGSQGKDKVVFDRMIRAFTRYEKELASRGGGPFFGGKKVCMVDFMLWPWFERIPVVNEIVPETSITSSNFPLLASWIRHMYELPAVKKTMFDKEHHAHFLKSLIIDKNPDYDYGLTEQAKL